jgi:hypothetical protein
MGREAVSRSEHCPCCGGDASYNWFDRSICPCGWMHTRCNECGAALDGRCAEEWSTGATEVTQEQIRGHVWSEGLWGSKTKRLWYYEVKVNGRKMLADNASDYQKIQNACRFDVAALRRIYLAGHELQKDYDQIMGEGDD